MSEGLQARKLLVQLQGEDPSVSVANSEHGSLLISILPSPTTTTSLSLSLPPKHFLFQCASLACVDHTSFYKMLGSNLFIHSWDNSQLLAQEGTDDTHVKIEIHLRNGSQAPRVSLGLIAHRVTGHLGEQKFLS